MIGPLFSPKSSIRFVLAKHTIRGHPSQDTGDENNATLYKLHSKSGETAVSKLATLPILSAGYGFDTELHVMFDGARQSSD